jgi:type I restriction enzyme, R subunit
MLTTGVDAKNVRNIVLLRTINSMTEFKQIIGRGTRVFEGKDYFTIIDFTGATNLFYDLLRDGEEVKEDKEDKEKKDNNSEDNNTTLEQEETENLPREITERLEVKLSDNRELRIVNIEIRYIDESGKPLTATQYLEQLIGKLPTLYQSEAQLRSLRSDPETREKLLTMLDNIGIDKEQFQTLQIMFQAQDSDIYDILAHLSFSSEIKSRDERVQRVKVHDQLQSLADNLDARRFLDFVLWYYAQHGSVELVRSKIGSIIELYGKGNIHDMMKVFGGWEQLMGAWKKLQEELFVI